LIPLTKEGEGQQAAIPLFCVPLQASLFAETISCRSSLYTERPAGTRTSLRPVPVIPGDRNYDRFQQGLAMANIARLMIRAASLQYGASGAA
jgi:hypothetical protein